MITEQHSRWYDNEPTVSLAVSLIKSTTHENQLLVAQLIIQKTEENNIILQETTLDKIAGFFRRWYDSDEKLFEAFERLRIASPDIQKAIAIEVIDYLCTIDQAISSNYS